MNGAPTAGRRPRRVVSGGQTGVDRAALDAALALGVPCGGWCPRGRRSEEGSIPEVYPLRETAGAAYPERTERNVCDSDGTLVLTRRAPRGGTALTVALARRMGRPFLVVRLGSPAALANVRDWIAHERIRVLNVAGPRESEEPGIHDQTVSFLTELLAGEA